MKFILSLLLAAVFVFVSFGQNETAVADLNLGFEKNAGGEPLPDRWIAWGSGYSIKADKTEKKSGEASVLLEPGPSVPADGFGAVVNKIPGGYLGKEIELRGFLKCQNVAGGYGGLFLRIDGSGGVLQFDNMNDRGLTGTSDWKQISIKLPLSEDATAIYVGALLTGKGKMWVDDLEILIDGKNISEAKPLPPAKATLDKEFDKGSKIDAIKLNPAQIEDLAVLGKVWGFLKYHHPAVTGGDRNWDYDLFRIMPKILAAKNRDERNAVLLEWTNSLGRFEDGPPPLPANLVPATAATAAAKLSPDLSWIDARSLGASLQAKLIAVKNSRRSGKSYYIGMAPGVGNPQFMNEAAYPAMKYPDAGFRLLSLYRYWNIIQYFYPNRHLIGEDWNKILPEFIPQFIGADDELAYKKAALALIARIHDTHANVWGNDAALNKFRGLNSAAVRVTFVEDRAVVTGYWDAALGEKSGLKIGDVIEAVNDVRMPDLVKERLSLTPASNYPTQLRDIARYFLRTNEGFLNLKYRRGRDLAEAKIEAYPPDKLKIDAYTELYQKKIPSFKLIGADIAYLYPGSLKPGDIQALLPQIAKTRGLIVDLRCYPADFIVFSLGQFLAPKQITFVKFSGGSVVQPGLFTFQEGATLEKDNPETYRGKVIILVNEISQSQAEYTAMALRVAPGAVVIGSTTAGADGNISSFSLPGGIGTAISGIGIYYPDGRETQRVGIAPDIVIKPTIKGIKEGRDELLDKALEVLNTK